MAETAHLTVEGMTCGGCAKSVTSALEAVAGVQSARVDLEGGAVSVAYDPAQTKPEAFVEAIEDAGFDVAR